MILLRSFSKTLTGLIVSAVLGLLVTASVASADPLPSPTGKILLTISGEIEHTNGNGQARFDREMLEALEFRTLNVETPWTEGLNNFSGPLVRDVLKMVGAKGSMLLATAINDYQSELPVKDAMDYDVIFAMEMNGTPLTVRQRGPLWVIFPWSDHEELQTEIHYSRSIWQLKTISVDD